NRRTSRQKLSPGDIIQIGKTQMRLEAQGAVSMPAPGPREGPLPEASMPLASLEGHALTHYQVGSVLARGQTGMIFHARDPKEDRTVALKVLNPEISKDEDEMQRFVRAMKTMMPLRHPNIVAIYGAGKTGPYCWIAMELVEGENLAQGIQRVGVGGTLHWRH